METGMTALLDQIETPCLKELYGYWLARRGSRDFPARRDLDPLDFRSALGHVVLLDVFYEPLRFRFRLHGTELVEHAGYDLTGKMVDDLPDTANRAVLLERCHGLIDAREPLVVVRERQLGKRVFGYEAVWMPLSNDGRTISMLMGGIVYRHSRQAGLLEWKAQAAV
jgi:hypothetical protein